MFDFHGRFVHDDSRADIRNVFARLKAISFKGVAGVDNIHDAISQAHDRCKLQSAIELNDIHLLTLA